MNDQLHHQYMRESNYCGRFKAWQMALIFMGFMFILAGGLPLVVFNAIPWLCRLAGLV